MDDLEDAQVTLTLILTRWKQKCAIGQPLGDPENPPCARLVLTGTVRVRARVRVRVS